MEHQCRCAEPKNTEGLLEGPTTTEELPEDPVLKERNRCLNLHWQCKRAATPTLFRNMVKEGLTEEQGAKRIDDILARRNRN